MPAFWERLNNLADREGEVSYRFYDGSWFTLSEDGIDAQLPDYFVSIDDIQVFGELLVRFASWLRENKE